MARAAIEQPISRYMPAARPIGHCCVFATWVRFAKMDRCRHAAPEKRMTRSTMRVASALQKARSGDPSGRHAQFWMMLETYKIRVTRVKSRILTATPSPRRTRSRPVAAICPTRELRGRGPCRDHRRHKTCRQRADPAHGARTLHGYPASDVLLLEAASAGIATTAGRRSPR